MRVCELADWLGATFEGDGERELQAAATLDKSGSLELAFVAGPKQYAAAVASSAGCLIVPPDFANPSGRTVIRAQDPRAAFARAVSRLYPPARPKPGIHATAILDPAAEVGEDVSIGPRVIVGAGARIGAGTAIGAGSVVGQRVVIGDECILHPNVTVYDDVDIGNGVVLHAGVVLGADGFGFVLTGDHYEKFPQVGRVAIGDRVEIGANSCVDRATLGVTWIGEGTKLDNMVHIAHNCRIGKHVVIAAQTGFAGGVVVEDYAIIGGQVGIGDKARIETGAVLGSGCGVLTSKVIRAGQTVWGTPARPLKEYLEMLASLGRLPGMRQVLGDLRKRVSELEVQQNAGSNRRL